MDNEIDRKIDVTAVLFLVVQNRQQTHDWTLIGSGANGLDIQECYIQSIYLLSICVYIHMLALAGETAEPNWLFFEDTHGYLGVTG